MPGKCATCLRTGRNVGVAIEARQVSLQTLSKDDDHFAVRRQGQLPCKIGPYREAEGPRAKERLT